MLRENLFSYRCRQCGRCCHDKVITLSPYDVARIARAADVSTAEAVRTFTIRRGSILRFNGSGACSALERSECAVHDGRPLACRLYPLGMERDGQDERFIALRPEPGSEGSYGVDGTIAAFLEGQGTRVYFDALAEYAKLLDSMAQRLAEVVDFEVVEPAEFRRCAVREALAESGYDPNRLIDAMFDPDGLGCGRECDKASVRAHVAAIERMIAAEHDGCAIAAAAVMLAVSLGYSPDEPFARISAYSSF